MIHAVGASIAIGIVVFTAWLVVSTVRHTRRQARDSKAMFDQIHRG